jgi:DNA-binding CsgD family transcriptional regulator
VTVAYAALSADRLAAHAALAEALDGDASTWHKARAARRPDESIAAAVEVLAVRARDHGAFAAAARAFERAARLTPEADRRADRLLQAGRAAHAAGHVTAALGHVDAALRAVPSDPVRRDAEHLRGRIIARSGSAEIARDQLVAVAGRCERDTPEVAAAMLADAVLPALRAGGPAEAVRIARRATRLVDGRDGRVKLSAETGLGTALIFAGEYEEGAALVDAAARSVAAADPQQRAYIGVGLLIAGRHDAARRVLGQLVSEARAAGALSPLPYALVRLAEAQLETGAWIAAAGALHEARRLARETGQVADYGLATGALAWLDAVCGREEDCRAHVAEAVALADRLGSGSRFHRAATALALLELARGHGEPAIDQLEQICRAQDEQGWSDAGATPHLRPELIEAYVLAGREADARATLEEFQPDAARTQRPSALAAAARCQALLADDGELDGGFAEASARAACGGPFEQARTELLWGDRLLGGGRAEEASSAYAHALETFEQLSAEPWATRARAGMVAAGYAPAPARPRMIDRLSTRELEVALACAEGGSPRAIAERLFLGVRTVELQLASATIKLGLNSTAELGDVLRGDTGSAVLQPT